MSRKPITMAILACALATLCVRTADAQNTILNVGVVYANPAYTGLSATGTIDIARFLGEPYVRKVNSTADLQVGNMTFGDPPTVTGHASIVFQYFPADNHINIPPGTSHITTSWGSQACRIYENGTCNCGTNPNWHICRNILPGYPGLLSNLAVINRAIAINALVSAGVTVTQTDVANSALEPVVPGISNAAQIGSAPTTGADAFVGLPGSK